jgi:predicted AlkP superfamily pyrophosphatase or phosphodiesterase
MIFKKKTLCVLILSALALPGWAQKKTSSKTLAMPKLVVGIVVDQMRYDYLYRYYDKYTEGGIKRLLNEGFNCRNHHYHYAPTVTAAGHAAIFTGSLPAINGMIGNEWYDQRLGRAVYCVEDSTVTTVGNSTRNGKMSPRNLLTSTVTDQLRIALSFRNKTIGIAQKDRGAILPAGHTANAAYWFDSKDGNWITSSFYMNELPAWAQQFNAQKLGQQYAAQGWELLLSANQYVESTTDDKTFEAKLPGEQKPVFPHQIVATNGNNPLETIRTTPWGNTLTKDFAVAAIQGENLGKGDLTDFLTVSFSSTDYIGHAFGPNSIEAQDAMLRLDRDLASLFKFLDTWTGKGQYLTFLTADHGVADIAGFWQENKLPAGVFEASKLRELFKAEFKKIWDTEGIIRSEDNYQLYLNHTLLDQKNITVQDVYRVVRRVALASSYHVADVINLTDLANSPLNDYQLSYLKNGYSPRRSGDIQLVLEPGWYAGRSTGTTHGVMYNYDTHVPFVLMGWGIKPGYTVERTHISDIAPTLADLLNILPPNGNVGKPVPGLRAN